MIVNLARGEGNDKHRNTALEDVFQEVASALAFSHVCNEESLEYFEGESSLFY